MAAFLNHGMPAHLRRAVFLDKDGTLVHDVPYNIDPSRVSLTPNAINGLRLLRDAGYLLVVVTNQAGIAKGFFSARDWAHMQAHLAGLFARQGIRISGFYCCPHHPQGSVKQFATHCACRKPSPGMLLQAASEHGIDLRNSWMIGDILHDVEAGSRAGCRTVLIDNGNETEWEMTSRRIPDVLASDLLEAAQAILAEDRNSVAPGSSILRMDNPMTE
ncbi:HAD family hydrolase [Oxalobacteraceae bacterium R-40]|uniref:D,D-heptose 1,7-bisphosphate phosphatase n=1 Tax=Keguizhuia sedimenti TaxID=3064264 RepID=A0ABU1BNN7_9BURK|nr:HAD family hydrolase [Oxalobacteraceae bacterium R-40]